MKNGAEQPIAITLGDPAGIGPEIVAKALGRNPDLDKLCRPVVIGNLSVLNDIIDKCNLGIRVFEVSSPAQARSLKEGISCINIGKLNKALCYGTIDAEYGAAAYEYIVQATALAQKKEVQGIVTAPINKEALQLAKIEHIDHTEMLSALTDTEQLKTLFITGDLRVFFYSKHIAFKDISSALEINKLVDFLLACKKHLEALGLKRQKLALAALNPHASDGGIFGNEEQTLLKPAVLKASELGVDVEGPVPADSVFHLAKEGVYDAVLSLYHDQGHIATKTLDFYGTVSMTLGLPFLRTSVDHGTAMSLAGKDQANEASMLAAIKNCAKYCLM